MGYIHFNSNPNGKMVGDCTIRAISKIIFDGDWDKAFLDLMVTAYNLCDMPSSNYVIDQYLKSKGFVHKNLPNTCPDCYTLKDFCKDHKKGSYIAATGTHVCAVQDGDVYDSWNSENEVVTYYYEKEETSNG